MVHNIWSYLDQPLACVFLISKQKVFCKFPTHLADCRVVAKPQPIDQAHQTQAGSCPKTGGLVGMAMPLWDLRDQFDIPPL